MLKFCSGFLEASLPASLRDDLLAFLAEVHYPLAVRSSSLLEDSQYQPFTGVYETFMLANQHPDLSVRLEQLMEAIKRVYASTFSQHAKGYVRATPYRLEEEKMAVIVQQVVGTIHGSNDGQRFYPDFSGVVRSHNFYPVPPMSYGDGIAAVALGLGRAVVDGGKCLTFCPRYPRNLVQFSSVEDILANSQREFWALELDHTERRDDSASDPLLELKEARFGLDVAESDGTLNNLGSTYSVDNNVIYDGLSRPGTRVVSFAPILKHGVFPLASILERLTRIGEEAFGRPVEVEFAVRLPRDATGNRRVWISANPSAGAFARRRRAADGRCESGAAGLPQLQSSGQWPHPGFARRRGRRLPSLRAGSKSGSRGRGGPP